MKQKFALTLIAAGVMAGHPVYAADKAIEQELADIKQRLSKAEQELAGKQQASSSSTRIGGYAEVHYNNLDSQNGGADKNEIDLHRAVVEFEHHFNKDVRAEIEIEIEHAYVDDSSSSNGELEVEQAFVEFSGDAHKIKLGQFILPVGILNKQHKPTAFYGVERNNVEKNIIPTTWWEAGALYHQKFTDTFSADFAITSGLNASAADNYAVRSGRQKGSEARADDLAYLATINWSPVQDLQVGASWQHQADITQGTDATAGGADLLSAHAIWDIQQFTLKALYATWDLSGSGPATVGADEQTGWYLEPSYRINEQFGVFARYSEWDNQAGDSADSQYAQVDVGVNYWPLKNVVIKADFQDMDTPAAANELDGFNLGVGFYF